MWRYIARRVMQGVICLIGVSFIVFVLVHISGDPVVLMVGPDATFEQMEAMRVRLGLDQPLHVQYWRFLSGALQGDLGESLRWGRPTVDIWVSRFPNTLLLGGVAFVISTIVGISVGMLSAIKVGTWFDNLGKAFAFLGASLPVFWVGLMFMLIFAVNLRWLPTSGMGTWRHLIMPALTLAWFSTAGQLRLSRSAMLDVLDSEYIKMARIKGVPRHLVIVKHALRNALIPIVTMGGLTLINLLTGTVIIETIFNWRGVGSLVVDAIYARDFPMVQTCALIGSAMFIFTNLVVDVLYAYIDPRIRYQ